MVLTFVLSEIYSPRIFFFDPFINLSGTLAQVSCCKYGYINDPFA